MTAAPVATARDDDQADSPGTPGWRAVLDPANLATWAAPIALVVLAIVFQVLNPTFLSLGNLTSMLTSSAILIVLAIGQTFVVATAGIDLSIASAMTLAAVVFGIVFDAGLLAAAVAAVVTGLLVGLVNGLIISRGRITDFIVTLGMLSAASGAALIFADGKPKTIISAPLLKLSTGTVWIFGYSFLIAIALAALAHVVLFHTRFGTYVLATGGNSRGSGRDRCGDRADQDGGVRHRRPHRRHRRDPARRQGRRGRARVEHLVPAQLGGRGRARRRQPVRRPGHHRWARWSARSC